MAQQDTTSVLFHQLSLNRWFKYLLYLGGIVFVLGTFYQLQFTTTHSSDTPLPSTITAATTFGKNAIVIGLVVWFLDDAIITALAASDNETAKVLFALRYMMYGLAVTVWVLLVMISW